MADKAQLMDRGHTYYGATAAGDLAAIADNASVEGVHRIFNNIDPDNKVVRRDGGEVEFIAVRNKGAQSALPKRLVQWKAGKEGSQIDGYAFAEWQQVAGVVDERLPTAGCRKDDICWIAIKGRHLVETEHVGNAQDADNMAVGDSLVTLSANSSEGGTLGGHPNGILLASAQTTQNNQNRHIFGKCLTARGTTVTATDMLVDLNIHVA